MKKLFLLTIAAASVFIFASHASEKVQIADYTCIMNDSLVYYYDSEYPLLTYKDVAYFPMTYDYCRAFSLSQSYIPYDGLYIAYVPKYPTELPIYETTYNPKVNEVVVPDYNVYVNGKKLDFKNSEYPVFNFRGVTYFPLTYDYAVNEFNMSIDFTPGCLTISSNLYNKHGHITVTEETADGAVLKYYHPYNDSYDNEYKHLDYSSGQLTPLSDYTAPQGLSATNSEANVTFDEAKGEVYFNDTLLPDVNNFKSFNKDDFSSFGVNVYGWIENVGDGTFLEINERVYAWKDDGSGMGSNITYLYVLDNGTPVYLGRYSTPVNAVRIGNDLYFSIIPYAQTVFKHYLTSHETYRLSEGQLTCLNDMFPHHGSVSLLGKANELLYLKCEWCPAPMLSENTYHDISPANDGWFTFDGEYLEKIANYTYTDDDIFTPDGSIYGIINRSMSVIKIH